MAKQKRKTPATMPRTRMITTDTEYVSPVIRKIHRLVESEFKSQIKQTNIPAFQLLSKTLTVDSFFLNHIDYQAILGDNCDILDRAMSSSICTYIANDIVETVADSGSKYVGVWDFTTLYNIAAAAITFMKHDTTTEIYLTGLQYAVISDEDLQNLQVGSYMPFSEYNINRFGEQVILIRRIVVDMMASIIDNKIPKAFLSTPERPLSIRMIEAYQSYMKDDLIELLEGDASEEAVKAYGMQDANERIIRKFVDKFELPFLTLMTMFMRECGISQNLINMLLGMSKVNIIYDDPMDKAVKDINITYYMTLKDTPEDAKNLQIAFRINLADAVEVALIDHDKFSKTHNENFGKGMRTFMLEMCTYAINIYTRTVSKPEKEEVATSGYIDTTGPITPIDPNEVGNEETGTEIGNLDVDELDNLLG